MAKRRNSPKGKEGGVIAGFSIMGAVAVATLVFVILNFIMIDEGKKDVKFVKDFVVNGISNSMEPNAMRRRNVMRR